MASFNKSNIQFHLLPIHLHFLFFLLISVTQFPRASHCCHEEDRSALLSFKSSLHDSSNRLSSWQQGNQHENCCDWHGIGCSNYSFRVISIDLRNKGVENYVNQFEYYSSSSDAFDPPSTSLIGKFSPSLLKVTHLEYLDLAFNNFQESQIPRQFFDDLTKLTHLDLSYSNFSRSIPTQFSNLSSLRYLDLSCRGTYYATSCLQISSTKWARWLVNLQVLRVSGIELNSLFPAQVANLTSLSVLELSRCNLHGSVPYLPRLKELDVSYNQGLHVNLTRMFIHQWPKLQKLWISSTIVNGPIPSSISNAPSLVSLSASSCSIQGSLPSSFYNLSQLQYVDLSVNSITGFIHPSFSNLKSLYHLQLCYNNFQGSIPESICDNILLQKLYLLYDNITGTIPSCITKLQNLRDFRVAGNFIEGNVSLFSLSEKLTTLDLGSNRQLSLDMRFNLDEYSLYPKLSLKYLWVDSCNLKGLFPISFCNLNDLLGLDVSQNSLTGTIPSCFFKLKYLREIYVSENKLHGPVPFPPQGIQAFDLSSNKFSGEISLKLGRRLSNAYAVSLAGNELSGSIPFTLCPTEPGLLTSTQYIDLSNNKLSGMIPSNVGYCGNLDTLKLGNNNLTGTVPVELKLAKYLRFLQLNNNHLDGTPLNLISELHELEFLNLANNNFGGSIPKTLGSLQNLRFLSLRSNKFNGSIPDEIIRLQELQLLDLSLNNLSGRIPNKLGNLRGFIITSYLEDMGYGDVQLDLATKGIIIQIKQFKQL